MSYLFQRGMGRQKHPHKGPALRQPRPARQRFVHLLRDGRSQLARIPGRRSDVCQSDLHSSQRTASRKKASLETVLRNDTGCPLTDAQTAAHCSREASTSRWKATTTSFGLRLRMPSSGVGREVLRPSSRAGGTPGGFPQVQFGSHLDGAVSYYDVNPRAASRAATGPPAPGAVDDRQPQPPVRRAIAASSAAITPCTPS